MQAARRPGADHRNRLPVEIPGWDEPVERVLDGSADSACVLRRCDHQDVGAAHALTPVANCFDGVIGPVCVEGGDLTDAAEIVDGRPETPCLAHHDVERGPICRVLLQAAADDEQSDHATSNSLAVPIIPSSADERERRVEDRVEVDVIK